MKQLTLILGLLLSLQPLFSQIIVSDSRVQKATLFLQSAEIIRDASVPLQKGDNEIVFEDLEKGINANSIQVSAPQDYIILSVNQHSNFVKKTPPTGKIKIFTDSLRYYNNEIKIEKGSKLIYSQERDLLMANMNLKGAEQNLTAEEIKLASEFYRSKLTELTRLEFDLEKKLVFYKARVSAVRKQLNELNYSWNKTTYDIVVKLQAPADRTSKVKLKYVVQNAKWVPRYDIRVQNIENDITLEYRADIFQNTGKDWSNIALSLSTGNPSLGGNIPNLNPWYLDLRDQYRTRNSYGSAKRKMTSAAPRAAFGDYEVAAEEAEESYDDFDDDGAAFDPAPTTIADYTSLINTTTTTEFRIQLPQNLPSDGKFHQVQVLSNQVPATFKHYAIPKLDTDAFLMARVVGWEDLNLLPGVANVYFEGTFIAETFIDPGSTGDTLNFSLGRDPGVVITRDKIKSLCETKVLGLNTEKTYAYKISVRNTKTVELQLNLKDQIPLINNKDITVNVKEKSGASLNDENGNLIWDLKLKPKETKELMLEYSVKYPKNKIISGL